MNRKENFQQLWLPMSSQGTSRSELPNVAPSESIPMSQKATIIPFSSLGGKVENSEIVKAKNILLSVAKNLKW